MLQARSRTRDAYYSLGLMKPGRAAIPKHVSRPDVLGLLLHWLAEPNQPWLARPPRPPRLNSRVLKRGGLSVAASMVRGSRDHSRPQFHTFPIGVCVQHGPNPPPVQRPR